MEESMRKSSLSINPFLFLLTMEHRLSPPPLELSTSLSAVDPHPPLLSAFGVMISAIIEKIAHSTSAPIAVNLPPDIPPLLVSLPNVTFAVDGVMPLASVRSESGEFVVNMGMWRMIVRLRSFPLNRQRIFTQVPLPLTQVLSNGVLIEPGAQLYEGDNVTIFLLFHNLLLLVCSRRIHILFGMCRYDYVSLLLVVHPFHSRIIVL